MNDDISPEFESGDYFWPTVVLVGTVAMVVDWIAAANLGVGLAAAFANTMQFGLICVVGMWLGMGSTRRAVRVGLFLIPTVLAIWQATMGEHPFNSEFFSLYMIVGFLALAAFGLRSAGWRVVRIQPCATADANQDVHSRQFSLRQMFAFITVAAVIAALLRFDNFDLRYLLGNLVPLALATAMAFFAAWVALGEIKVRRIIALALLPVGLLISRAVSGRFGWLDVLGAPVEFAVVLFTLLPFRMLGYRARFRAHAENGLGITSAATEFQPDSPDPVLPDHL